MNITWNQFLTVQTHFVSLKVQFFPCANCIELVHEIRGGYLSFIIVCWWAGSISLIPDCRHGWTRGWRGEGHRTPTLSAHTYSPSALLIKIQAQLLQEERDQQQWEMKALFEVWGWQKVVTVSPILRKLRYHRVKMSIIIVIIISDTLINGFHLDVGVG